MSSEDIKLVEETLKCLMLPNNEVRKQAEAKLSELMNNKPGLCLCLSNLLIVCTDLSILTYAAVVLRKLLEIKEDENVNPVWAACSPDVKGVISKNVLASLVNITNKNLKQKVADVAIQICLSIYENDEKWNELFTYVISGFNAELNEANLQLIETSVYILAHVFIVAQDELLEGIDIFVKGFKVFFTQGTLSLRTRSVQAITEILAGNLKKKQAKKFRDFVFYILETILKCVEANDENNLKICLTSVSDMIQSEPSLLSKSFSDVFILMGKIIEKKDFVDENIREISFEIIVGLIEYKDSLISKDPAKLAGLIEAIFKYALEIEETIDEDWTTPKTESFFDEEYVPEEKLDTAMSLIERLIGIIGSDKTLETVSGFVMQLLGHSDSGWKYKYIAYMTIANMMSHIDDITTIDKILMQIFADTENQNPKIRYACLYCISEASDNLNPDFQNSYHEKVVPATLARVKADPALRVQLQACSSLQAYLEHCTDQVAGIYITNILDVVFGVFLQPDTNVPVSLKECLLDVISELVSSAKDLFNPFAEKCLTILVNYLSEILKTNTNKSLFGMLLEVISIVGPICQEVYSKYVPDLVNTMIQIQSAMQNTKDPVTVYLQSSWEKIIPIVKSNYPNTAPAIIESMLALLKKVPEMSVSTQPETKFDIQNFLRELNTSDEVNIEKKKMTISTSETEEYSGFLDVLKTLINQFKDNYLPYVETTEKEVLPLINFPNDDIRANASNCLPELIEVIKSKCNVDVLHQYAKNYLSQLITALENEADNSVIATFLDNVGAIIEKTGLFLTTPEINVLCSKLLGIFDKVEKSRLSLLNQKDKVEDEFKTEKEKGDHKIYSDDEDEDDEKERILENIEDEISEIEEVLISYADVIGIVFKTHKELSLEIVNKLLTELLPKYFQDKATNFEKKMGLFILDDMVEFLGQEFLNSVWTDIGGIIVKFADSKDTTLRQAACYGVGEFSKRTVKDFNLYINNILEVLVRAADFHDPDEDKETEGHAKDNAVAALGKVIKTHGNQLDLPTWVAKWFSYLPIKYDTNEGAEQHTLLCDILENNSTLVTGAANERLSQVIRILAQVYNTDFSSEELNKRIENICQNLKNNPDLHPFILKAKEDTKKKTVVKLEQLFK